MNMEKTTRNFLTFILLGSCLWACNSVETSNVDLPIYGNVKIVNNMINGKPVADTVYHTIPEFSFTDQDSTEVTNKTFNDKIYVSDFFFTSCPDICPAMKTQMLRIYQKFREEDELIFLSHTIDPKRDSVTVLKDYSERLGVDDSRKWHFVTGDRDEIFEIALNGYFVTADDNPDAPGGFIHSGALVLIDKEGRVRGAYDGTSPERVDQLMNDISILLTEYNH